MNRYTVFTGLFVGLLAGTSIRAAETTSPLDLVPKDAAGFVHLRVGDVWKHNAFAPVRDYLTKIEPTIVKDFQGQFGFVPADVDTLTLIYPSFNKQALVPPVIVVRTVKPYDKAKVLTAMRALSAAQFDDWDRDRRYGQFDQMPIPRGAPFPVQGGRPFPINPPLPPAKQDFAPQCGPNEEADEPSGDPFEPRRPKPDLRARHYVIISGECHLYCLDEQTLVFVPSSRHESDLGIMPYVIQLLRRQEKGPLSPALAEAAKHTAVIAIDSTAFARMLPAKLGSEDAVLLRPLTMSKLAMLSLDLGQELTGTFTFTAATDGDAKKLEDAVRGSIGAIKKGIPELRKEAKRSALPDLTALFLDQLENAVNKLAVKQIDSTVTATTSIRPDEAFMTALKAGMAQVRMARERTISQNNLKQIGLGLHSYHDANGRLPFPGVARFGAPLGPGNNNPNLSWRVAILPYLEQTPLYQQFKLDEPWDSEHNKKLIDKMPKIYAPVNGVKAEKGHTFYQIFTGREAIKPGMRLTDITDGTSNTFMVVEAGDAVPWTRPEDMLYDSKKPLPKLGALFNGSFNALFMDGSVRFISKDIDEKILRALITPSGGEVTGNSEK